MRGKYYLVCVGLLSLTLFCSGCEAFRKKFIRKAKKEEKEVNVVVFTQEYESQYSAQDLYKRYYIFWRAAHDELIDALGAQEGNYKKRIAAAERVSENLQLMRSYLVPEKQTQLDIYISKQQDIVERVRSQMLGVGEKMNIKSMLESQKRQIEKQFFYKDVSEHLVVK
ncbi:MAG: hypothetical protein V1727_00420 [Candidatus Omnitrophota bacterium]